jgi:hypothetical protein
MSADFILMEGIRMVDEWPIIEKKIPSMDIVFRTVVDPSVIEIGGAEDGGGEDTLAAVGDDKRSAASMASKVRLTPAEERVYRRVDGSRTVQAVIDSTGLGEFEVCRTLFDLLNRNIIAPVGRGAMREQAEGRGAAGVVVSWAPGYAVAVVAVALALAGVVWQRGTPFAVSGLPPALSSLRQDAWEWLGYSRLEHVDRAIVAYYLANGSWPSTLGDVVTAGLLDRAMLLDPASRPYHYALTEQGYILSVLDADGRALPGMRIERSVPGEPLR